ncbi:glycogen/starch synthase [Chitinispirillales bacterium ANBcel5]|uniref:glycogen/starch synthase n=1 Tax=Cellulosispirillum alkaliphilum TaxID=3039283 RepID=UPI002A4E98E9|nr:glycogen/starch synthase [Chitinispirillales bacterium ANBcel5]
MNNFQFDYLFTTRVESWAMFRKPFHDFFSEFEIDTLFRSERTFDPARRTVVFLSFENRFASLGGLAAIARLLPLQLHKNNERTLLLTPLHSNHKKIRTALEENCLKPVFTNERINLCSFSATVDLYRDVMAEIPSYYIGVRRFFTAEDDPYAYPNEKDLLLDSLAFSAAVPFVLNRLGITKNLVLHANDWETAPVAITSKMAVLSNLVSSARTVLTLHNSFDHGISNSEKVHFFGKSFPAQTILQSTIPLLNGPLTTVSGPFDYELRHDPLQSSIFTTHLQHLFSANPPIGVENGFFGKPRPPYHYNVIKRAALGDTGRLLEKKNRFREELHQIISKERGKEVIGKLKLQNSFKTPLLFMSGRLDLMQKGFDVIFHALKKRPKGSIKLLFCPSSASPEKLDFFKAIEKSCRGDIEIWPFRIPSEQYKKVLLGASFLVMPSFYEPFGAANEGFMHGTPVLARGTGGLWVQVRPANRVKVPDYYNSASYIEGALGEATGLLYREEYEARKWSGEWRECLELPPGRRVENKKYRSMVQAAGGAIDEAVKIFADQVAYGKMISNGIRSLKHFSWDSAVEKYKTIYDHASFRGNV